MNPLNTWDIVLRGQSPSSLGSISLMAASSCLFKRHNTHFPYVYSWHAWYKSTTTQQLSFFLLFPKRLHSGHTNFFSSLCVHLMIDNMNGQQARWRWGHTDSLDCRGRERNNKGGRFNSHTWLHFAVHIGVHFCLLCANQKRTTTGPAHFTEAAKTPRAVTTFERIFNSLTLAVLMLTSCLCCLLLKKALQNYSLTSWTTARTLKPIWL